MSLSSSQNSALSGSSSLHQSTLMTLDRDKMTPSIESSLTLASPPPTSVPDIALVSESTSIKKGVMWEQQQNRFFFNRWKERFFILTTDYLSCFKKAPRKAVGMSEMGSFVYKINLNEIKTLTWVDKKKNGVIGVQLANTVIFLWNSLEGLLDEWMTVLQESTSKTKVRRETLRKSNTLLGNGSFAPSRSPLHLIERNSINLLNGQASSTTARVKRDAREERSSFASQFVITPEINLGPFNVAPPPPPPRRYIRCQSTTGAPPSTFSHIDASRTATQSPRPQSEKLAEDRLATFYKVNATSQRGSFSTESSRANESDAAASVTRESRDTERMNGKPRQARESLSTQSLRVKPSYHLSPLINSSSGSPHVMAKLHQPLPASTRASTSKRVSSIGQFGSLYNQHHQQQQPLPPRPKHQTLHHAEQAQLPPRPSSQSMLSCPQPPKPRAFDGDDLFTTDTPEFSFIATRSICMDPYERRGMALEESNNHDGTPPPLPPLPSHRSSSGSRLLPSRHSTISSSASLMLNGDGRHHYRHRNARLPLENGTFAGRGTVVVPPPPVPPHRTHIHHF